MLNVCYVYIGLLLRGKDEPCDKSCGRALHRSSIFYGEAHLCGEGSHLLGATDSAQRTVGSVRILTSKQENFQRFSMIQTICGFYHLDVYFELGL